MAINIHTEPYNPERVELIRKLLESHARKGSPRYFEVLVDGLKVVPRTCEVEEFDSFEDYVTATSKEVKILLYSDSPTSPRNTQFVFSLQKKEEPQTAPLNGIDIDARISEKVAHERERWDTEQLKKELSATKEQLKEAEEYIDLLQEEVDTLKTRKPGDDKPFNMGEFLSVVTEGMVRRNPQWLTALPGGESLAGFIEKDNQEKAAQTPAEPQGEATFKKKESTPSGLSEEQQHYITILQQMEHHFEPEQLQKVMEIIHHLAENMESIDPVAELLNISI